MCGGCDVMVFQFSNLLYIFEKLVAWCAICCVLTCIIFTVLVSVGLGVGVGYNYSVVSMKVQKTDSAEIPFPRNDSSGGHPSVPISAARFRTQNVATLQGGALTQGTLASQSASGGQNEKISGPMPVIHRISSRKGMPSRFTQSTDIHRETTVPAGSGFPVTFGLPDPLPSKFQAPDVLKRTEKTQSLPSAIGHFDNLRIPDTIRRLNSGVTKDESTVPHKAESSTTDLDLKYEYVITNAFGLTAEPETAPTRTAIKMRKYYDYRPWWRKISRKEDKPKRMLVSDTNADPINSESNIEDTERRKTDAESLKTSKDAKEATVIVPLNKSLNILPLLSKILDQKQNITLQFIKMR